MRLIEIFLPSSTTVAVLSGAAVREDLTKRFSGLTAFSRSPAQGTISDETA
jgi:hypothetical protein